jgi:hypothetical protein
MERSRRTTGTRFLILAVMAVTLILAPATARAGLITAVDYTTISGSIGSLYVDGGTVFTQSSNFLTADLTGQGGAPPSVIGRLTSSVYYNSGIFTYVLDVTPLVAQATRLSTGFLPTLYNNTAGWDFNQAFAAGSTNLPGGSTAFFGVVNTTNLGWTANPTQTGLWDASHLMAIRFFLESTTGPGVSNYNLSGTGFQAGSAFGYAPVAISATIPEPSSLALLTFTAIGIGVLSLRRAARATGSNH